MSDDEDPDWIERLLRWLDNHQERALLYFLGGVVVIFGMVRCAVWVDAGDVQRGKELAAIRHHMAWLQSLPETEKRIWPVLSYCRPASTTGGYCLCEDRFWLSEVQWMERLENGDVACHVRR